MYAQHKTAQEIMGEQLALFGLKPNGVVMKNPPHQVITELREITEPVKEQLHYD